MEALVIARNAYKGMYVGNKTRLTRGSPAMDYAEEEEVPSKTTTTTKAMATKEERYNNKKYDNYKVIHRYSKYN